MPCESTVKHTIPAAGEGCPAGSPCIPGRQSFISPKAPAPARRRGVAVKNADVVYCYDGSFEGFLCCVFASFQNHELPFAVFSPEKETATLYPARQIETEASLADRVFRSFANKLGDSVQDLILTCFLSGDADKELHLLRFLHFAYPVGPGAAAMLGNAAVAPLYRMEKAIGGEAHLLKGFIRFEEHDGMLGAVISPKNYVLPLLRYHFCERFPEENFMIYDDVHSAVLLYQNHRAEILQLAAPLEMPKADAREQYYQTLWKQFYKTLEVTARHNEKLRRSLCPKRYWRNMTELKMEL